MKIFNKRIPKGNILVLISFVTISLWLIIIISLSKQDKLNNIMKKGLYTGNEKWFEINNCKDESYWNNVLPELTGKYDNFAVYVDLPDPKILVRGIYVSGKVVIPPMLSGSYFDEITSGNATPKVVLGKEFESNTFYKDEKKYYDYYGTECEVLGVMGTEKDSRINHMIVMDFMTALKFTDINTEYEFDVKDKEDTDDIGEFIYNKFQNVSSVYMAPFTETFGKSFINYVFDSEVIMDTVYAMMLISFVVCTMLVTLIWLRKRHTLFESLDICGFTTFEKMCEIAKRYYIVAFIGFVIGLMTAMFITNNILIINMELLDVIQAFAVTIGIGTVVLICSFVKGK